MGRYGLRSIGQGRSHTRTQHTWAPVIRSIPMGGASCRLGWPYAPYVRRERSLCVLPGARAGHVRAVRRVYLWQRRRGSPGVAQGYNPCYVHPKMRYTLGKLVPFSLKSGGGGEAPYKYPLE